MCKTANKITAIRHNTHTPSADLQAGQPRGENHASPPTAQEPPEEKNTKLDCIKSIKDSGSQSPHPVLTDDKIAETRPTSRAAKKGTLGKKPIRTSTRTNHGQ